MAKVILFGAILTLIFNYSLVLNSNKPLDPGHADAFFTISILKHYFDTAKSGNWSNLPDMPMFYGFKNTLFYSDNHFIQAVIAAPIYLFSRNIILTFNTLALLTLFLSYLSMYLLSFLWTKNVWASILAGIIFAFNPFIYANLAFPDSLNLYSFQFYPLIFFFLEKTLRNPKGSSSFWLFFFLACQQISSLYYASFLLIFLPIYFFVRIRQLRLKLQKLFNKWAILGALIFILVTMTQAYIYLQIIPGQSINRDLITAEGYSARPIDYLLTGSNNLIYGNLKSKLLSMSSASFVFASGNGLFLGVIPIVLLILSFRLVKGSQRPILWLFWGLLVLAVVLSFGPKIHLIKGLALPGPYRLIYEIPIFKFLRIISRFGFVVIFFASLICALTIESLLKEKTFTRKILVTVIIFLVSIEYLNKPLDFQTFTPQDISFYQKLQIDLRIKVILDYPIGNNLDDRIEGSRPVYLDGFYLLLASTLHNKILFNGYNGFIPTEYYQRTEILSVNFPTVNKLEQLKKWGVDAIVLHKDQFQDPHQFETIKTRLGVLGLQVRSDSDHEALYTLYDWPM